MDSIIFDLDGTIWDSREAVLAVWNQVLQNRDIETKLTIADFSKTMGLQVEEIGRILLPQLSENERNEVLNECNEQENSSLAKKGGLLYDDVESVLEYLSKRYKLFIVSNCQDGYIESFYEYHQLEKYFQDFENPGRTGLPKGKNIQLIVERNQLAAPVYVGDTKGDCNAAKEAGVQFVFAEYGFGEVEDYDYRIQSFKDLREIF
ncbi:HAD family hydrolase [Alkalihalobacillus alcalophilus ATCC 27647 = CGMCC 1.3604]|uniref:HAD family hydrolase n=1 Tax=Alkalihalobacillus alcalophilus ATCC 27647 = CGMCC 1.3604 TaxID=1218173 RepID=A0A094WJB0_ALKAL|nr:HAD family hydrolase [Alkalihalobacillus alcalophilus]KGA97869.1 HAD family hydrolase [Alkalihalobacillus alcalophilus ATCC 27647 = CGMCC 1.3604]MED1562114.1 HAD family hydrolase [Alkalihalobacillus alcalophilus]THG91499.1 HAD family hydrolase [Alkalihalobacillus alcalophilus ATCC 27647 = CGMCC 1.3604]